MKRIFEKSTRLTAWRLFSVFLGLMLAGSAQATDPLYQNNSSSYYSIGGSVPVPPPTLDVNAFDNENIFSISYENFNLYPTIYETLNTAYYTNNGTMIANSPPQTNNFLASFSNGYLFDQQTATAHNMAGTFYNAGKIRCNSTNDGNNIFNFFGVNLFTLESLGYCTVNATNIISYGTIDAGPSGLIKLTCQNADLSFGSINLEPLQSTATLFGFSPNTTQSLPNLSASGNVGSGFNNWIPSASLGATYATSSIPNQIILSNSTPYIQQVNVDPFNVIVRAVFIVNNSPGVPYKVYFGNPADASLGQGGGTIEWAGIYKDPATCNYYTNYLYLNDFYELVTTTNLFIANGVPGNFTFTESTTPLIPDLAPASSNFVAGLFKPSTATFPQYAYVNAQFLSSSVATNASQINPSGAITNLPGKIFITASNDLNMPNVQISGENYLSLIAPNQFDGSPNAQIYAPYADINLGVTNGSLNLANLIANSVPTPSGNIQAWSGEWFYTDTNSGINYDFRVAIVSSQLTSLSQSWIRNLRLHSTNNLVVNDVMNVYNSMFIDAQNLVVATNACGSGFTSFSGQLNWANPITFGPTQIPNVLWLTNNGTITAWSDSIFGTSGLRYGAFINNGLIGDNGTTIWTTNFVNSGWITNGSGAFTLQTQTAVMTNGVLSAGGNVSITGTSLVVTNEFLLAGRSLTLAVTNLLTDGGFTSNFWSVGSLANTGDGLVMTVKPTTGDLLGTTITNIDPANKSLMNIWAGQDRGYSVTGFSNNAAIGHLVFDSVGSPSGRYNFQGAGVSNAIYVDEIEFKDNATNFLNNNMTLFNFNTNLVIYYAQAMLNGVSFAFKLNGYNTNHFRWVPAYAGYFSSTNIVYPDGSTNTFNAALAQNNQIDSDGDGTPNASDSTPFFIASQINLKVALTNAPTRAARLSWQTIPNGTNTLMFKTNLLSPSWAVLTNFVSPQPYGLPATNVVSLDLVKTNAMRFYRVSVQPWLTYPF